MKQEERELLIRDLCARLQYGVKCKINKHIYGDLVYNLTDIRDNGYTCLAVYDKQTWVVFEILNIKPYLFPLSSMTEEQKEELVSKHLGYYQIFEGVGRIFFFEKGYEIYDWFNKNHFDYRGLIEKGLAIDATNMDVYK